MSTAKISGLSRDVSPAHIKEIAKPFNAAEVTMPKRGREALVAFGAEADARAFRDCYDGGIIDDRRVRVVIEKDKRSRRRGGSRDRKRSRSYSYESYYTYYSYSYSCTDSEKDKRKDKR